MKPFEHGGNVYDAGVFSQAWLDFSANINPLGLSDMVKKSILDNMENLVHYPDPTGAKLKQVISVNYGLNVDNIILGNGAVELMYVYFHCYHPKRVLIPVPSFSEYERGARAAGCQVEYLYLDKSAGFPLNQELLMERLPEVDAVVLGNPNNPTGTLMTKADVMAVVEAAQGFGTDVMVDESFLDFLPEPHKYSVMDQVMAYPNLIVISSMTKFYAIPGLRLGFGVAGSDRIEPLDMGKDPWNVNLLAQMAGVAALQDEAYKKATRQRLTECIKNLYEALRALPELTVYEPSVNFILVGLQRSGLTAAEFTAKMRKRGILVRDCSNYPGMDDYHVRFAVRLEKDNERLLTAVKAVLQEDRG